MVDLQRLGIQCIARVGETYMKKVAWLVGWLVGWLVVCFFFGREKRMDWWAGHG